MRCALRSVARKSSLANGCHATSCHLATVTGSAASPALAYPAASVRPLRGGAEGSLDLLPVFQEPPSVRRQVDLANVGFADPAPY